MFASSLACTLSTLAAHHHIVSLSGFPTFPMTSLTIISIITQFLCPSCVTCTSPLMSDRNNVLETIYWCNADDSHQMAKEMQVTGNFAEVGGVKKSLFSLTTAWSFQVKVISVQFFIMMKWTNFLNVLWTLIKTSVKQCSEDRNCTGFIAQMWGNKINIHHMVGLVQVLWQVIAHNNVST